MIMSDMPPPSPELPKRRTTLILPIALLEEAERLLGVASHTDAVVIALEELVARRHRRGLLEMDWSDLTPEAVDQMRLPRQTGTSGA
jgi:hypothetical protein